MTQSSLTVQTRFPDRYAVLTDTGWLGRGLGHDYQNNCPRYDIVKEPRLARLYLSKGAATKAAKVVNGKPVRVLVEAVL